MHNCSISSLEEKVIVFKRKWPLKKDKILAGGGGMRV